MTEINQESLDAHLAALSANLTPEQAEEFQRTAKQRIQNSGHAYTPESVDGAFALIDTLARAGTSATELPGKTGRALSALDPRKMDLSSVPGSDLVGRAGDAVSGAASGLGRVTGSLSGIKDSAVNLGSGAAGKASDLVGGADGVRQSSISAAGDVLGFSGKAISGAGNALSSLKGMIDGGGEVSGAALGTIADLLGKSAEAAASAGDVADLAGTVLGALGDVLGSLGDI